MYQQGVAGTSTEDVQAAAGVSASQIYHYFGRQTLTHVRCNQVLERCDPRIQQPVLARLDAIDALRSWAETIVDVQRANDFRGGCPLGSLAGELADRDDAAREDVVAGYRRWQAAIAEGLAAMRDRGALVSGANVDQPATALLTALQGGLLLAKTQRDGEPLRIALDIDIDHIVSFATAGVR